MKIFKSDKRNKRAQKIANASWIAMAGSYVLSMLLSSFTEVDGTAIFLVLLIPLVIFFVPLLWFAWKSNREAWEEEKREQQYKEDAEDKAIFGKPLREFEN